jgi:cell wall-associated NlpC family hydrolase
VQAQPGDVAVVRTSGIFACLIRLGAWLRGAPHKRNHVAIVAEGGSVIEAEPGGVTVGALADYPAKYTLTNVGQPKTAQQREAVVNTARSMLRHGYDWLGIAEDALAVFDLDDPAVGQWATGKEPAKVVCSSLAAYVYTHVGLEAPTEGRFTWPDEWTTWIKNHDYQAR